MKSSYPVQVKVYLKAMPAAVITVALITVVPILMLHAQYFRHERLPKSSQKQTPFEELLACRDLKYRHLQHDYFTRQPHDVLNVRMILD